MRTQIPLSQECCASLMTIGMLPISCSIWWTAFTLSATREVIDNI